MIAPSTPKSPWRRRGRWLLGALVCLVAGQGIVGLGMVCNPRRGVPNAPPPVINAALRSGRHEQATIPSHDGRQLQAEIFGAPGQRPLIIYGHGYRGSRRWIDPVVIDLLDAGFSVLAFDFAGSGDSPGWFTGAGAIEQRDIPFVVEFATARLGVPPRRIGYVGFSMGAAAGAMAGRSLQGLGAVVLIASYASMIETVDARSRRWAHIPSQPWLSPAIHVAGWACGTKLDAARPVDHIHEISPTPLMLVAAPDDWRAPIRDMEALFAAAAQPKRKVLLPQGDHAFMQRWEGELKRHVVEFFVKEIPAGE